MDELTFAKKVLLKLPYTPNDQQVQLIAALARFCSPLSPANSVFLLNGYAGTGKTSLIGALVQSLEEGGITTILLAPTGRAAKVFSAFARYPAYTIHRKIYYAPIIDNGSYINHTLAKNKYHNAIFLVDEASMIGSSIDNNLLDDLIHYVYAGDNCRLLLLGDTAQLPPVGCSESPAMDVKTLKSYGLRVTRAVLTATVRQGSQSGILFNATWLRRAMLSEQLPQPMLYITPFDDVKMVLGEDLAEEIADAYNRDGIAETILITRSNKRATQFNFAIRSNILYKEEELSYEEQLLVAKNNYYWSAKNKNVDFIANGDVATIMKVYGTEMKYGFRFADVRLQLPDREMELDAKILLNTLISDAPSLSSEQVTELYNQCINDPELFSPDTPISMRLQELKKNPYFNALQVKYAYAVTCHKAQGGQWRNVFVDMGYISPDMHDIDFYRWLYTATSRATKRIYYVNPTIVVR